MGKQVGLRAEVPLAGHVRVVAARSKDLRQRNDPIIQVTLIAWFAALLGRDVRGHGRGNVGWESFSLRFLLSW